MYHLTDQTSYLPLKLITCQRTNLSMNENAIWYDLLFMYALSN